MRQGCIYGIFFLWVATSVGCVGGGKIDRTNATLAENLEQLKVLNKNFVAASRTVGDLRQPMDKMVEVLEKRDAEFSKFVEQGTAVSQKTLALLSTITPESIQTYGADLHNLTTEVADFNDQLAKKEGNFQTLLSQMSQISSNLRIMGKVADLMGLVSPEDRINLTEPAVAIIDTTAYLNDAARQSTADKIQKERKISWLSEKTVPNALKTLEDVDRSLNTLATWIKPLKIDEVRRLVQSNMDDVKAKLIEEIRKEAPQIGPLTEAINDHTAAMKLVAVAMGLRILP